MKIDLTEREFEILGEALTNYYDLDFFRHSEKEYKKLLKKLR